MNDRPTAAELVGAVRLFLERELLPTLSDARLKFQALVAANVLGIAGHELASEEESLRDECDLLRPLVGDEPIGEGLSALRAAVRRMNERLCDMIRAGAIDDDQALRGVLRELTRRKQAVASARGGR